MRYWSALWKMASADLLLLSGQSSRGSQFWMCSSMAISVSVVVPFPMKHLCVHRRAFAVESATILFSTKMRHDERQAEKKELASFRIHGESLTVTSRP